MPLHAQIKSNRHFPDRAPRHGESTLRGTRYRIDSAAVEHNGEFIDFTGRFTPIGLSDKSVSDILASHDRDSDVGSDDLTPAQRFILAYVAAHSDRDGEVPSAEVIAAGDLGGYQDRDLIKARNKIKHLVGTRKDGMKGGWVWFLTDHPANDARKPQAAPEATDQEGGGP